MIAVLLATLSFVLPTTASLVAEPAPITVYSARKEHLIKPVFEAFTKETKIPVRYLTGKSPALVQRLRAEGAKSDADLFLTVDAGNLWFAAQHGLFAETTSEILERNIPNHLRDPKGRWFGFSVRARTIVYSTERVKVADLSTYEALAQKAWKGRLCLRTSKKVYNQSLVAMLIAQNGQVTTEQTVRGWVANLAEPVLSSDTKLLEAVIAGRCDVGIVNTYYFGRLKRKQPNAPIQLFWPNQTSYGVHVNVSGAGILKTAKNPAGAKKLVEWLSTEKAQHLFADLNLEYPTNPKVEPAAEVQKWGHFKHNQINIAKAGELQTEAVKLMDRARYQ